jgi:glutathione synthase/RimK-type ligase-like ATP-grasp enzyme
LIALATSSQHPELAPDDRLLLAALRAEGADAEPAVWDLPGYPWASRRLVVIRSTWDYVGRREAYLAWAESTSRLTPVENDPATLRWNTDKGYLAEFGRRGHAVVPSEVLEDATMAGLERLLATRGWDDAVVKPVVGAGGRDTFRVRAGRVAGAGEPLAAALARSRMLVQPFLPVVEEGELSLLFFDGSFSHAARKRPAVGEFRVQEQFGGSTVPAVAAPEEVTLGRRILEGLDRSPLYARLDFLRAPGGWLLSEIELTEPSMFLALDPGAPTRFARAVLARA